MSGVEAMEAPRATDAVQTSVLPTRGGEVAVSIGFFAFGFAVGSLTGFSSAQGVSLALLSSLFTFVGGVVLTFTGFRRVGSVDASLDPARVSAGLCALSLGLVLGVVLGVYGRCNVGLQRLLLGENVAHSQCLAAAPTLAAEDTAHTSGGAGLMANESDVCQQAAFKLEYALRDDESERAVLQTLMSKLSKACKIPQD